MSADRAIETWVSQSVRAGTFGLFVGRESLGGSGIVSGVAADDIVMSQNRIVWETRRMNETWKGSLMEHGPVNRLTTISTRPGSGLTETGGAAASSASPALPAPCKRPPQKAKIPENDFRCGRVA